MQRSRRGQTRQWRAAAFLVAVTVGVGLHLPSAQATTVRLNPLGYHPQAAKRVVLEEVPLEGDRDLLKSVKVVVVDPAKKDLMGIRMGRPMFETRPVSVSRDPQSAGPTVGTLVVDLSAFQTPGNYTLRFEGLPGLPPTQTPAFKISEFVFWDSLKPVVRSFYLQRAGQAINDPAATGIFHPVSHPDDAYLVDDPSDLKADGDDEDEDSFLSQNFRDVNGGWYDPVSRSYAKYTGATALATAEMLSAYTLFPKAFKYFKLDYPPQDAVFSSTPEYLHEIRYGLDWLLAMQRQDGAFYRKVDGLKPVSPGTPPQSDTQRRYLYGVSTVDSAMATASLATAVRAYRKADLSFAVRCLLAAEKGWQYLKGPEGRSFFIAHKGQEPSASGEPYFNPLFWGQDMPYRLWAATELFLATGKKEYQDYVRAHLAEVPLASVSYTNPTLLGYLDYVQEDESAKDSKLNAAMRQQILALAGKTQALYDAQPVYPVPARRLGEASSRRLLSDAQLLLGAYSLSPAVYAPYRQTATGIFDYLMGLNPLGKTFLTGVEGEFVQPVNAPCHPLSLGLKKTLPGLLVNGPNPLANGNAGKIPVGLSAAVSYRDQADACESNGTSLLNNAALVQTLILLNGLYNAQTLPSQ
jgi:endoglucanase